MTSPVFSVVVPVHNAGLTIAATVASVLAQTEPRFELILIDDGSTDASLATLLRLATTDPRIRVVSQPNAGVAATRNLGMEIAAASLVAFLDADDLWDPTKLAAHLARHRADPQLGASYAQIGFIDTAAATITGCRTRSTVPAGLLGIADLIGENPVCTASNIVATRECIASVGGFRAGMGFAEDQEWLLRVAAAGFGIAGIDTLLVGYRTSPGGLSADLRRMYAGWHRLVRPHRARIDVVASEAIYCRYLSRRALRAGGSAGAALGFALRGLRLDPRAFLADRRRGGLTLAAAAIGFCLPTALRTRLFA